jgi:hypothetical protein
MSSTMALLNIVQRVSFALNSNKNAVMLVALDFQKAFDSISHPLLIQKLTCHGSPRWFINWVYSYLNGRTQIVRYKDCLSSTLPVLSGVPQGSIIGPYLFNFFINDLTCLNPALTVLTKYADDSSLVHVNSRDLVGNSLSLEIEHFLKWADNNKLKINLKKSAIINFGKRSFLQVPNDSIIYSIPFVDSFKLLGLTLDCMLSWNLHINDLVKKQSRTIVIFRLLRNVLSKSQLYTIYLGITASIADYAAPIFIKLTTQNSAKLERIHRRVHYAVCNLCSNVSCPFNLTSVKQRRYNASLKLYNYIKSSQPNIFADIIPRNLKFSNKLCVHPHKTSWSLNSFIGIITSILNDVHTW